MGTGLHNIVPTQGNYTLTLLNNVVNFLPPKDFVGTLNFSYTMEDYFGTSSYPAIVVVNVIGI